MAPVATTDPVVLSGADVAQEPAPSIASAPPVSASVSGRSAAQSDIAEPVEPPDPVVASPAPVTPIPASPPVVANTTPTRPPEPAPQVIPASPPVASTAKEDYPNINIPPAEPGNKLLSPEERAKLIAELNALANRNNQ